MLMPLLILAPMFFAFKQFTMVREHCPRTITKAWLALLALARLSTPLEKALLVGNLPALDLDWVGSIIQIFRRFECSKAEIFGIHGGLEFTTMAVWNSPPSFTCSSRNMFTNLPRITYNLRRSSLNHAIQCSLLYLTWTRLYLTIITKFINFHNEYRSLVPSSSIVVTEQCK